MKKERKKEKKKKKKKKKRAYIRFELGSVCIPAEGITTQAKPPHTHRGWVRVINDDNKLLQLNSS